MVNKELLHIPVGCQHQGSTQSLCIFLWAVRCQHRAFTHSCGQSTLGVNTQLLHIPVGSQHQGSTQSFYTFLRAVNTRGQHTAFTHSCGESEVNTEPLHIPEGSQGLTQSFYTFLQTVNTRGQHRAFTHSCGQSTPVGSQHQSTFLNNISVNCCCFFCFFLPRMLVYLKVTGWLNRKYCYIGYPVDSLRMLAYSPQPLIV